MTRRPLERWLAGLAVAWVALVALVAAGAATLTPADVASSPDRLAAGEVWRLLSSALIVDDDAPLLQVALLAGATAVVLVRHGAIVWWIAALAGHIGSALLAYALIGVAAGLGSPSADRVGDDWDYGISCVLAALLGVLFAGAIGRLRGRRRAARDVALVAATSVCFVLWLLTVDWYGLEHLLAFAIGAAVLPALDQRAPAIADSLRP